MCWGQNAFGQALPSPPTSISNGPVLVRPVEWGRGEPSNFDAGNVLAAPATAPALEDAVGITIGYQHACALTGNGVVICWGDNSRAQLSPDLPMVAFQRGRVDGLPRAIAISAAGLQTCAVVEDKSVWCWGGYNEVGQLGTGDKRPIVRKVPNVHNAEWLQSELWHVCARVPAGFACWGADAPCFPATMPAEPQRFAFPKDVTQLARVTGDCLACALYGSGALTCSVGGARGGGTDRLVASDASSVSAGEQHACLLTLAGQVKCWGSNNVFGQCGRPPSSAPIVEPHTIEWGG